MNWWKKFFNPWGDYQYISKVYDRGRAGEILRENFNLDGQSYFGEDDNYTAIDHGTYEMLAGRAQSLLFGMLKNLNAWPLEYKPEKFDCDNFASLYAEMIKLVWAFTNNDKYPPLAGTICMMKDSGGAHMAGFNVDCEGQAKIFEFQTMKFTNHVDVRYYYKLVY